LTNTATKFILNEYIDPSLLTGVGYTGPPITEIISGTTLNDYFTVDTALSSSFCGSLTLALLDNSDVTISVMGLDLHATHGLIVYKTNVINELYKL
jgi:hypothetical protein